mgnify:CR=1 FL=1
MGGHSTYCDIQYFLDVIIIVQHSRSMMQGAALISVLHCGTTIRKEELSMYSVNRERLLQTFTDLVKISSPSWNEAGVIDYIVKKLKPMKIQAEKIPCGKSHNLLVRIDGEEKRRPALFSCHTDTVVPCENVIPVVTSSRISSDGTTILGADDKAAVAAFIEAITCIHEQKRTHGPLEFLFSCAEEVGLCGIKCFDMSLLKSKIAFVFDSGGEVGKVIIKAPYHSTIDCTVKGKSAHAGMEPEKGVSAIKVLSEIISKLPHGRIDNETTVNVGLISGGSATNIVAEEAYFKLEARSVDSKKLKSIEDDITLIIHSTVKEYNAKAVITRNLEYSGFTIKENDSILGIIHRALGKINITPQHEISGGGSDTNIINRAGIKAVNLSIGMRNVHTKKEYIMIKDLMNGARFVLALIDTV